MEIGQAKRIFFTAKKAENVTGRTIETYDEVLKKFLVYIVERNIYDIAEVKSDLIREFLGTFKAKGLKGITVHRYFRVLRTFFLFLYRDDYIPNNPMKNIKPPKIEKKAMRTFTIEEINKLLNAFNKLEFFGMRNYVIMCMFFSTGIRKMELASLTLADLNIINDLIRIRNGKGQKERYIPIGKTLRRSLIQYLKMREEYVDDDKCLWLFPSKTKEQITSSGLGVLFQKVKKELGMTGEKISAHTWRHTFAKNYLLNGGDVFSLQTILGHSNIETTRGYIALNQNELKTQMAKFNPLDNKDWLY
ncbi:MAG: hypothetical protein EOM42_06775 [Negativicutes bacterium]|nr:hypothetical protein [Negativicutes bacterium]